MESARACLLAAGRGRRMGRPKAWLPFEGSTLLERQVAFLAARFGPGRVLVSVQAAWLGRCAAIEPAVLWVPVPPDAPAMASLQALLAAAGRRGWAFVHHVDMPVWEGGLFDALDRGVLEAEAAGLDAVAPSFRGRRGHPVALSPAGRRAVLSLDPASARLDEWLRGARTLAVEVPFGCAVENWNRPEEARAG